MCCAGVVLGATCWCVVQGRLMTRFTEEEDGGELEAVEAVEAVPDSAEGAIVV